MTIRKNKYSLSSDEDHLWKRLQEGNISALERVMHFYFRVLFDYGSKFTADRELIKDAIQELFIVIWNRKEYLGIIVNLKAYLFASLRRLIFKKRSSGNYAVVAFDDGDINGFDFEFSIEEKLIESEQTMFKAQRIRQLIDNLPQRQKEIIYLKFFQNLSREEIAEILHLNPQTVSNHLQAALKSMRFHRELISLLIFLLIYVTQLSF